MKIADTRPLNARTARPVPLTPLGLGGAPLGNLYKAVSDAEADATIRTALDLDVGFYDTAPFYGLGLSEERMGRMFAGKDVTLSTKVGRIIEDCPPEEATPKMFVDVPSRKVVYDYGYGGIMRSYEDSLRRLGRKPDILLVHDIDPGTHGADASADHVRDLLDGGGYRALSELRAAGDVAAIGAGVNAWEMCEELLLAADFDCFLLAGRYTLLEQEALNSFLPLCEKRDVGILLGGPYNSGILATGAVKGAYYNYEPAPAEILQRVARIEAVCADHGVPLIAAALQFVLGHPAVRSVIPGARSAQEVEANVGLMQTPIPGALWRDLRDAGLIHPNAPLPGEPDAA